MTGDTEQLGEGSDLLLEVRNLNAAVGHLSETVTGLHSRFDTVNDLMAKQQDIDRKASDAVLAAANAVAAAKDAKESTVSREDLENKFRLDAIYATRAIKKLRRTAIIAACTALVLSLVALGASFWLIKDQQDDFRDAAVATCEKRVENSKLALVEYGKLLESPVIKGDEALRGFIGVARDAAARGAEIDCSQDGAADLR